MKVEINMFIERSANMVIDNKDEFTDWSKIITIAKKIIDGTVIQKEYNYFQKQRNEITLRLM